MRKLFFTVLSMLLAAACDAYPTGTSIQVPSASAKKALPVISVGGSEIRVNGQPVWLGDTLDVWKRVLGGDPTCYDAGMIISCVWHSNGLTIGTDHLDKTRVKFMNLHITIEPSELGERAPSWPRSAFQGTLELDGIHIRADTAFRDLRRQVPPARELRCGGSDCGNPSAAFSEGANIHMNLARRSENAPILHFSIACIRTKLCTELIPDNKQK